MSGSSGRSLGRIGLTVIGGIVGGAFGMPGVGAAIGGMLGGLIFPEKIPGVSGPRLGDQQLTTSTEGTAIPLVYGRHVVSGNIIWAAPLEEVQNTEEQGGKGGPSQKVTTFTYFLSHAVALCEGTITGVPRIWENGKLIYDRRAQQDGESATDYAARLAASDELDQQMTIYLGSETQMPDSLIESVEGVGEVSAHRGLAYVVFERRDVTDSGGRPKQYQFEIMRAEIVYTPTTELAADYLPPWLLADDPRSPDYPSAYEYRYSTLDPWGSFGDAQTDYLAATPNKTSENFTYLLGHSVTSPRIYRAYGDDNTDKYILNLHYNRLLPDHSPVIGIQNYFGNTLDNDPGSGGRPAQQGTCGLTRLQGVTTSSGKIWWSGLDENGDVRSNNAVFGIFTLHVGGTSSYTDEDGGGDNCLNYESSGGFFPFTDGIRDSVIGIRRVPVQPEPPAGPEDWPVDPDNYTWDPGTSEIFSKAPYVEVAGDFLWLSLYEFDVPSNEVTRDPLGPVLEVGDAASTEAYWTAARDAAVTAGTLPSSVNTYDPTGMGGVNTFPRYSATAWTRTYTAITYSDNDGVTVGSIVREQCERSGLTNEDHFDISTLGQIIKGYKVERLINGRDIIAPLRQFGLFDGVETDKLRFPLRGGAVVATLTADDLGAHEFGSNPPPLVETMQIEDVELPYAVRVRYADVDSEYQPGAQPATRKVTAGSDSVDIETTIAMDATEAAQMADILLQEPWMRRQSYDLNIGPQWLALTAADPILIPLRGETQRCVISEDTRAMPGIIEAKAFRDDASIYSSNATGTPGGAGEQTLTPIGDTDLVIIDSAAYMSTHNDAGVFLAACGASDRWDGYGLFESTDGGSNFSRIAAYETASTMGTLIDAIPEGPFDIWDYENEIVVAMDNGTLESRTQDELLNGANAMFVGSDGRWEIIQFASAVAEGLDSGGRVIYRLSTLLRGRQGTEWAIGTSQAGDRMAMCFTTQRLAMEVSRIGIPRLLKAISFGRTTESGPEQTFTPQGVALKPYAPWLPEGQRDGSGNLTISWVRRTRIGSEWKDSDYTPLNEELEAYEVDIISSGSPDTVLQTLTSSIPEVEYTASDQLIEIGFGDAVDTLDVAVRNVMEVDGYVYGIFAGNVSSGLVSIRSYSYSGDDYTYIGGEAVGSPIGDVLTGFVTDGTALFVGIFAIGEPSTGVYRFQPSAGAVGFATHYFDYSGSGSSTTGLTMVGADLWVITIDDGARLIVNADTADLSFISSIDVTGVTDGGPIGIASDGTDLYVTFSGTSPKMARYTTAGAAVWTVDVEGANTLVVLGGVIWVLGTQYLSAYSTANGALVAQHLLRANNTSDGLIEAVGGSSKTLLTYGGYVWARSQKSGLVGYTIFDSASPNEPVGMRHDGAYFCGASDSHMILTTGSTFTANSGIGFVSTAHRPASSSPVSARIYQISTSVGRGYVTEAIL